MIFMVSAYSSTSNNISYMEKIRSWKILSTSAMSSSDYTHDVQLYQPCMCNNNDRAARSIKFLFCKIYVFNFSRFYIKAIWGVRSCRAERLCLLLCSKLKTVYARNVGV